MKARKKTQRLMMLTVLLLIVLSLSALTYAFVKAQSDSLHNQFHVGEITTEIEEHPTIADGVIHKDPSVLNTGVQDCLIRMRVNITPKEIADFLAQESRINYDTNHWIYHEEDGFWYYQGIVKPQESTKPLFTEITGLIDTNGHILPAFAQLQDFDIILYQEAVQAQVYDAQGTALSASKEDGTFDPAQADLIWSTYKK